MVNFGIYKQINLLPYNLLFVITSSNMNIKIFCVCVFIIWQLKSIIESCPWLVIRKVKNFIEIEYSNSNIFPYYLITHVGNLKCCASFTSKTSKGYYVST